MTFNLRQSVIEEFSDRFLLDDMKPAVGHFLVDQYRVHHALNELAQKRINEALIHEDPMQDLGQELLIFADSLLDRAPNFYSLAGFLVGIVAGTEMGCNAHDEIEAFSERLVRKFRGLRDVDHVEQIEFETYFCMARMVQFESRHSDKWHSRADHALRQVIVKDIDTYQLLF